MSSSSTNPPTRIDRRTLLLVIAAAAAVFALGIALIAPRFDLNHPSLIDDWGSLDRAPRAIDAIFDFKYFGGSPPDIDPPGRYRPGFVAAWNGSQWHTFGAPNNLTGPNAWNLLRLLLFVASLSLAVVAAAAARRRNLVEGAVLAALSATPAALVLATPSAPVDFARFGPQEPLLIGALLVGTLLLLRATARALAGERVLSAQVAVPAVAGYLLWLLGVYMKEASICFLAFAPFLYFDVQRRWRDRDLIDGPLWRQRPAQILTVAMLLPLIHMVAVVVRLSRSGTTVYGAKVPSGSGWIDGTWDAIHDQFKAMPQLLGTSFWKYLAFALPLGIIVRWALSRQPPWLAIGAIATGWGVLAFQGLAGASATRYYIPVIALFALAGALLLVDSPPWLGALAVVGALIFVGHYAPKAHDAAQAWTTHEQVDSQFVDAVAALAPSHCPVYESGLDIERHYALRVIVGLRNEARHCLRGRDPVLVQVPQTKQVTGALGAACAPPGWRPVRPALYAVIFACDKPANPMVKSPDGQTVPAQDVLRKSRVTPTG